MKISKKWTKLDNRGESNVEFVFVAFLIVIITIFVICIEVHAAEPETEHHLKTKIYDVGGNSVYREYDYTYTTPYQLYGVYYNPVGDISNKEGYYASFELIIISDFVDEIKIDYIENLSVLNRNDGTIKNVSSNKSDSIKVRTLEEFYSDVDKHINSVGSSPFYTHVTVGADLETDIPYFDSFDSLKCYLQTGDDSGMVNKPAPDYNHEYDFSNYQYDINIPLPELSQVTHNGFKVDNVDGYYIDVIMETNFCGVKVANAPLPVILPDYNWVYKRHTYNFTIDDRAINNSVINIKDIYGVDSTEVYWNDFIDWSSEYNTVKKISTYKWYDIGLEDSYKVKHIYNEERFTALGKEECLRQTLRRKTLFYVRLYDKNAKYGQWVKYEINDFVENDTQSSNVTTGVVDGIGIDGKPIVKDEINGYTDSSGNISYRPNVTGDTSVDTANSLSGFKEALNSFTSAIGQLPELVNKLLGFLPWWATALLGCVIVVCVILRVVGR